MKKASVVLLLLCVVFAVQAQDWTFGYDHSIKNVKGVVKFLENQETVVIIPNDNASGRYIASNLPEEYKIDGLKVTFSGDVGKIPPHIRMLGTPLKLKSISVCGCEQKKHKLKKRKYTF